MKRLLLIAVLALAACDDQPKQRAEQLWPTERPAQQPVKRVKITLRNVMHLTRTPKDGTTPQQIADEAINLLPDNMRVKR